MRTFLSFRNLFSLIGFLWLSLSGFSSQAQTTPVYGNEWINYGQPYYKIKVVNNGIHRLTYTDLVAAGITNVNPQKFQLFRRGKEVAIYVNGQSDGALNAGDYIDFYGQKNDGATDSVYYSTPRNQIHKHFNIFQDTAAYFLTWGAANGKRMQVKTTQNAGLTPEPRLYAERLKLFTESYFAGYQVGGTRSALGDRAEGFMTWYFNRSRKDTLGILPNVDNAGRNPLLEVGVVSGTAVPSVVKILITPPNGPERVLTNATTGSSGIINIPFFDYRIQKFEFLASDIYPNGSVKLRTAVADSIKSSGGTDYVRLSYYKVTYPRTSNLNNNEVEFFTDSLRSTPSYFLFDNTPANAVAYDLSDPYNVVRTEGTTVGSQRGFSFDPSVNRRKILIAKGETTRTPIAFKSITFNQVANPRNFDYIIITHKNLRTPVAGTSITDAPADYATYRTSAKGGGYSPLIVDINDLYDQFHYGEKASYAISNFMEWMLANGNPEFLFLMGRGLDRQQGALDGGVRADPAFYKNQGRGEDLIPTFGFPASDVLLTANWRAGSFVPKVPTGRLPVETPKEIVDYFEKGGIL